jgi:Xaa-Pro aminopeptidase
VSETVQHELGFEPLPELFQSNFSAAELAGRRLAVLDRLDPGDIVLVQGAPAPAGSEYFRQHNDFFYLSGVEVPSAYLLLDGRTRTTTLYLPHRDADLERSEGRRLAAEDAEEAQRLTGIETVAGPERLALDLQRLVLKRGPLRCHTPLSPAEGARAMRDQLLRAAATRASDPWDVAWSREARFARLVQQRFPQIAIADLSPLLDRLRLVKSESELHLLRIAGRLSARAVREAMGCTRAGITEYELAAVADFVFSCGGARGEGYHAIVATGHNAWFGHYGRLGSALRGGELVLMDYAPDVAYYTSDIGRMWPVSGRYSPLQRLLYGFIVEYHRELLALLRPGALPDDILAEAAGVMRERIEQLHFPGSAYRDAALAALRFAGHLSHPVGMSVHDVGDYTNGPLEPGMVFAVDPMMWVHEHELYIRCEDTVAVTEHGVEVLTADAPLDVEEVEQAMTEPSQLLPILASRTFRVAGPAAALADVADGGHDGPSRATSAPGAGSRLEQT